MTDVRTKNETEKYTRYGKKTKKETERKRQEKISREEKNPGFRGNTDAHWKASQGYHHGDNQPTNTSRCNPSVDEYAVYKCLKAKGNPGYSPHVD